MGGDIRNPQSLNRYAYALNNPTTLVDPLGLNAQPCTAPPGYILASTNPCVARPLHTCLGMVCADQYYGGSIFEGFTGVSSGMGICFSKGVAGYCNQGALSGWSLGGYDEFDINLPSSGVYWTAAPGSAVINQSGRTSTNTGTLGFSDTLWSEATGTSNVLEFTGSTDPKVQFGKLQQIQDLLTGNYVFAPSTPSASSQGPGVTAFGTVSAWIDTISIPNPLAPWNPAFNIPFPIFEPPRWSALPGPSGP